MKLIVSALIATLALTCGATAAQAHPWRHWNHGHGWHHAHYWNHGHGWRGHGHWRRGY